MIKEPKYTGEKCFYCANHQIFMNLQDDRECFNCDTIFSDTSWAALKLREDNATQEQHKPELIAYTNGFEIIPFDNVIFVSESSSMSGGLCVMTKNKEEMYIPAKDAEEFIDKYNYYLLAIEKAFVGSVEE